MKKVRKIIWRLLLLVFLIGLIVVGVYAKKGYDMYAVAKEQKPITTLLNEVRSKEDFTPITQVPKAYLNAMLAIEDHRFYRHGGVDIIAIARAIFNNIVNGKLQEGGSTITQQVCKNLYFTQERKLERKFAEVFMAFDLERECSKETILELYFNTIYFGNGYYSLKSAANGYFHKDPIELTDFEATFLAGIPNAPSVYAPTVNLRLTKERQKQVLSAMVKYHYITEQEKETILKEDIDLTRFEK